MAAMEIGSLASTSLLTVGPDTTVRQAARAMAERRVGSAVVTTDDGRPAIITERDVLRAVASGGDLDAVTVGDYMTPNAITATRSWDAEEAAREMRDRGFRHLLVLDDNGSVAGVLSIRDLVGLLLDARAPSSD